MGSWENEPLPPSAMVGPFLVVEPAEQRWGVLKWSVEVRWSSSMTGQEG